MSLHALYVFKSVLIAYKSLFVRTALKINFATPATKYVANNACQKVQIV
jgi:hypothetical protein